MVDALLFLSGPAQAPEAPAPAQAPAPPAAPAVIVGSEQPAPGRTVIQRNGKVIFDGASGGADQIPTVGFPSGPPDIPSNVYMLAKDGIVGFTLMIIAFPVFGFLKALVLRRANTQAALPSRDTTDRLQRIEAAVEAMSVEVERISEGQRFVTRVLSERSSAQT